MAQIFYLLREILLLQKLLCSSAFQISGADFYQGKVPIYLPFSSNKAHDGCRYPGSPKIFVNKLVLRLDLPAIYGRSHQMGVTQKVFLMDLIT